MDTIVHVYAEIINNNSRSKTQFRYKSNLYEIDATNFGEFCYRLNFSYPVNHYYRLPFKKVKY